METFDQATLKMFTFQPARITGIAQCGCELEIYVADLLGGFLHKAEALFA